MNYIYDIVLNFQDNYYQFFEWSRKDKIKNIGKISVYRVNDEDLLSLKYNQVTIDNQFLNQVKEDNKKNKKIMCLVSNTKQSLGILISPEGTILKRSSLLFEEEDEVNNYSKSLPLTIISYIENNHKPHPNKLRIQLEKKDTLIEYLTKTNDLLTLKYLYYEYYEQECDNKDQIKKSLLQEINKEWNPKQNNLYQIIKLLNQKNQKKKIS